MRTRSEHGGLSGNYAPAPDPPLPISAGLCVTLTRGFIWKLCRRDIEGHPGQPVSSFKALPISPAGVGCSMGIVARVTETPSAARSAAASC